VDLFWVGMAAWAGVVAAVFAYAWWTSPVRRQERLERFLNR
jgi:hypothetical protein